MITADVFKCFLSSCVLVLRPFPGLPPCAMPSSSPHWEPLSGWPYSYDYGPGYSSFITPSHVVNFMIYGKLGQVCSLTAKDSLMTSSPLAMPVIGVLRYFELSLYPPYMKNQLLMLPLNRSMVLGPWEVRALICLCASRLHLCSRLLLPLLFIQWISFSRWMVVAFGGTLQSHIYTSTLVSPI